MTLNARGMSLRPPPSQRPVRCCAITASHPAFGDRPTDLTAPIASTDPTHRPKVSPLDMTPAWNSHKLPTNNFVSIIESASVNGHTKRKSSTCDLCVDIPVAAFREFNGAVSVDNRIERGHGRFADRRQSTWAGQRSSWETGVAFALNEVFASPSSEPVVGRSLERRPTTGDKDGVSKVAFVGGV